MNPAAKHLNDTNSPGGHVETVITETDIELVVEESEKMREHIQAQATEMGPILEALLHDTGGRIRWGLNE